MTDLNKVNFMSKTRFDNLSVTNDDELYIVETDIAIDSDIVHKTGAETIAGNKTFSNNLVVSGTSTFNNSIVANSAITVNNNNILINNGDSSVLIVKNSEGNQGLYGCKQIEFKPLSTDTHGGHIDFHYAGSSDDYTARLIESASGDITYSGSQRDTASSSTTSGTLAVKGWVNDPAKSTNVVHRSGDETIAGTKTLIKMPALSVNGNGIGDNRYICKVTTYQQGGSSVSLNTYGGVSTRDKNGIEMGTAYTGLLTDGSVVSGLFVKKPIEGSTDSAQIRIQYDSEGVVTTSAPTPLVSDNSSQIATTAWVNTKVSGVTSQLDNKLDLDVGNANSTTKQTIVDWCMPNFSGEVSKNWNTEYTADKAGILAAYGLSDNTSGSAALTVGGKTFTFSSCTTGNVRDMIVVPVAKGIKYKATGGTSYSNLKFYPLKGV